MKKKKSIIVNSVIAATVATSVFAVTSPADAASASSAVTKAEKAVVKAEKLGGALKWEISLEYRKAKYPKNVVGYPNMKLFGDTKKALADARAAVAGLSSKDKAVLSARLDANVQLHVNRTTAYIDAVTSGLKILNKSNELKSPVAQGVVNDKTEQLYHAVNAEIKKNSYILDRVYGATTRDQFRAFYKQTAVNQVNSLLYPLTIKIELDRANTALKAGNLDEAATRLGNASYFVNEAAAKKGQAATDKLIVGSLANQQAVQADFNSKAALYIAKSTNVSAPTVFGPATGSETIGKTVYVYVGQNEQLKLQNVSIDGNLVVLGSPAGGGSVYLENVKVNKGTTNSGKIIVKNVADHSLNMKNVQADSVQVDDTDGYRLVFDQGTKTNSLTVSEGAGQSGKGTIESKESGTIGTMTIASKGNAKSEGLELQGNFSTTSVSVTGQNTKLGLAQGAEVKSIDFKAPADLTIPAGAKVGELTKDPSVSGNVNVDNKGTVEKANSNINVGGNAPGQVTTPGNGTVTPPTDPGTTLSPRVTGFKVNTTNNKSITGSYNASTGIGSVDLATLLDSDEVGNVVINTADVAKLSISAIKGSSTIIPVSLEYTVKSGTVTINSSDLPVVDGVNMGTLRNFITGQTITLTGKLYDANNGSKDVSIVISLGGTPKTTASYTNDFGTVTKTGAVIDVSLNSSNKNVIINNTETAKKLFDFAAGSNVEDFKSIIAALVNKPWEQITVGDLVGDTGRTISKYGYTFNFTWA